MHEDSIETAIGAHQAILTELEKAASAHDSLWADGSRRADYDRWYDLRSRGPSGGHDDAYMAENHPEETRRLRKIESDSATFHHARSALLDRAHASLGTVLSALGTEAARRTMEAFRSGDSPLLVELVDAAYRHATKIRHERVDGRVVAFDPDGPFTRSFLGGIAKAMDVPDRKRGGSITRIAHAIRQPAYALLRTGREHLDMLDGIAGARFALIGEEEDRVVLLAKIDVSGGSSGLAALRDSSHLYEMHGPFVADPYLRTVAADPMDPRIVDMDARDIDATAGRYLALLHDVAIGRRSPTMEEALRARKEFLALHEHGVVATSMHGKTTTLPRR